MVYYEACISEHVHSGSEWHPTTRLAHECTEKSHISSWSSDKKMIPQACALINWVNLCVCVQTILKDQGIPELALEMKKRLTVIHLLHIWYRNVFINIWERHRQSAL